MQYKKTSFKKKTREVSKNIVIVGVFIVGVASVGKKNLARSSMRCTVVVRQQRSGQANTLRFFHSVIMIKSADDVTRGQSTRSGVLLANQRPQNSNIFPCD